MNDIFDTAVAIARAQAAAVHEGLRLGEHTHADKVRALTAAYRRALLDPSARIPTYLHAACEQMSASDRDAATAEQRDDQALSADPRSFK